MATCNDLKLATPTLTSGVQALYPAGPAGMRVAAYCDMTQSPAGQSLFDVPSGTMALTGRKLCTLNYNMDDMDSTLMWVTFEGKITTVETNALNTNQWYTLDRDEMGTNIRRTAQNANRLWGSSTLYRRG